MRRRGGRMPDPGGVERRNSPTVTDSREENSPALGARTIARTAPKRIVLVRMIILDRHRGMRGRQMQQFVKTQGAFGEITPHETSSFVIDCDEGDLRSEIKIRCALASQWVGRARARVRVRVRARARAQAQARGRGCEWKDAAVNGAQERQASCSRSTSSGKDAS
eukprot:4882588-Pleurochrysis_carterae.AAC.4